jgi:hypothetical protein
MDQAFAQLSTSSYARPYTAEPLHAYIAAVEPAATTGAARPAIDSHIVPNGHVVIPPRALKATVVLQHKGLTQVVGDLRALGDTGQMLT